VEISSVIISFADRSKGDLKLNLLRDIIAPPQPEIPISVHSEFISVNGESDNFIFRASCERCGIALAFLLVECRITEKRLADHKILLPV
jgi:hypothetical protein